MKASLQHTIPKFLVILRPDPFILFEACWDQSIIQTRGQALPET